MEGNPTGAPPMHVADHLSLGELRARAVAELDKRLSLRLRAVFPAASALSAPQVAAALGPSRRAAQRRVARYNAEGPDALGDRPRAGQPTRLPEGSIERLRERIDAGPTPADGVCSLRAKDIRSILAAEFGVAYNLPGVYPLLHRLGYSCLDPRPRHRKSDPLDQEEFKKNRRTDRRGRPRPPGPAGRGLVRGRGPPRPEGDAEDGLGRPGVAADRRQAGAVRLSVGDRGGLPGHGGRRRDHHAEPGHRDDQRLPGRVLASARPRRPGGADLGRGGVPHGQGGGGSGQRLADPVAWYSPELNPVENLWHYLRSHYWTSRFYPDWEALMEGAIAGMVAVGTDADLIKTVLAAPYITRLEGAKSK